MIAIDQLLAGVSSSYTPALIIVAILMPFWYLYLYLFGRIFFQSSSEVLKWVTAFCLSFGWFIANAIFYLIPPTQIISGKPSNETLLPFISDQVQEIYFSTGGLAVLSLLISMPILNRLKRTGWTTSLSQALSSTYVGLFLGLTVMKLLAWIFI